MKSSIPIINESPELYGVKDKWFFDEAYACWCLEDILYTQKASTPKFQRMSIFVPKAYMSAPGTVNPDGISGKFTAKTAPVVFENNSAGYMQMPHTWLGGPRDEAEKYLKRGMVYVTCGCRGRESRNRDGVLCAKSPWTLVDLKTAIRFLRHNKSALPGDFDRIISVGWSAGGAMSTLIGVTGDNANYTPYLEENGAFMEESDAVYAAQIYCPIIDLEHADLAYEWQFHNDSENEASPAGPAGIMDAFRTALSGELYTKYISYFNSLGLKHPKNGMPLTLNSDGRSGSAYDYLMDQLEASATDFLTRLSDGTLPEQYTPADYLAGRYTRKIPAHAPAAEPDKEDAALLQGHADPGVSLPAMSDDDGKPSGPPSLGDLVSRPPKGVPFHASDFPMVDAPGASKENWLSWDGQKASITDLDTYVLCHRRRMKPCTSFDTLGMDSGENQVFGTPEQDYMHFNQEIPDALKTLKADFPDEYARYYEAFAAVIGDETLARRCYLINPLNFIGTDEPSRAAKYYRIRVGACDADTAFIVSMTLAVRLANHDKNVDYKLIWDKPHCEADYPFEVCDWIEQICERKMDNKNG